jgi:hypothetical protein
VSDQARIVEVLDAALEGFRSHGMLGWAARATGQKEALTTGNRHSAAYADRPFSVK